MTSQSRQRFAEVVRSEPVDLALACALVGVEVEPSLDVDEPLRRLDRLAERTSQLLFARPGPREVATALRLALADEAGLSGSQDAYEDVRSSLLHEVLRRGTGLPILLSIVWAEVARRAGVSAYPVALPGRVVVGVGDPDGDHVYADPFSGGWYWDEARHLPQMGLVALRPEHERPASPVDLLLRLLTNVRGLTGRMPPSLDAARMRLWAVELSLLLPRHPLELRRERGELLVRLGDHVGGAVELEGYAALVEDADGATAETVRREARQARARLN